jgi:hypothetical protein
MWYIELANVKKQPMAAGHCGEGAPRNQTAILGPKISQETGWTRWPSLK